MAVKVQKLSGTSDIDFFNSRYCLIGKWVMYFCGLWPYEQYIHRLLKFYFFCTLSGLSIITQVGAIYKFYFQTFDHVRLLKALSSLILTVTMSLKYYLPFIKTKKLKVLCQIISKNWTKIKDPDELEKLQQCSELGRKILLIYMITMSFGGAVFISIPFLGPLAFNYVQFRNNNNTQNRPFILDGEYYFFNKDDYYWPINILEGSISWSYVILYTGTDFIYVVSVQHCVGLIVILKSRLRSSTNSKHDTNTVYLGLIDAVNLHRHIIQFGGIIHEFFSMHFLVINIMSLFIISVGINCILVHIHIPPDLFRFSVVGTGALIQLFYIVLLGQMLIDHSGTICDEIYHSEWYKCSAKIKKLLLFIMLNNKDPLSITAAGFVYMRFEHFVLLMKTGASYMVFIRNVSSGF